MSEHTTYLVIEHEDDCPPNWLGDWWAERGIELRRIRAHRGDAIPTSLGDADALVVLGGEAGANDDADYPWLPATRELIATTVGAGMPFLGVCLGHQLAARALGGVVTINPDGPSNGITAIALTPAGEQDRFLGGFQGVNAVQWNYDIVRQVPPGAEILAYAPDGSVQALRFAPRAYGVQFHPECSPDQFDTWTVAKPSAELTGPGGERLQRAAARVREAGAELEQTWRPLADRFVELVAAD